MENERVESRLAEFGGGSGKGQLVALRTIFATWERVERVKSQIKFVYSSTRSACTAFHRSALSPSTTD